MTRTYHGPSLAISMLTSVPSYDSAYTEHTREILSCTLHVLVSQYYSDNIVSLTFAMSHSAV